MISELSVGGGHELEWRKSSYSSNSSEADCVEVAPVPDGIYVRDSKNVQGPRLTFGPSAWAGFVSHTAGR
ncbi:DUF397 domain-containing protein [Streptomyces sp. NPDC002785]|uniref:DUF397 domain-containing protein n=1 Tax=Streptomyces sp. NPDC002785 TaxID=3154543 RepID=UPI00332FB82F